jgi:hypothetical protein
MSNVQNYSLELVKKEAAEFFESVISDTGFVGWAIDTNKTLPLDCYF